MRALALVTSIMLTLVAAGCAALLIVPGFTKSGAFVCPVVDEKTWVLAVAGELS